MRKLNWSLKMAYVLAVDIGSTQLRCFAFSREGKSLASHFSPVVVIHPEVGASEIDPENIWNTFQTTVKATLNAGNLDPKDAVSFGSDMSAKFVLIVAQDQWRGVVQFEHVAGL